MHVLRKTRRDEVAMDFVVHTPAPCHFGEETRSLGADIHPCLHRSRPVSYARDFLCILREHGPYDVVHCHLHYLSALCLWLAHRAGVPVRVAHSHSAQWCDVERPSLRTRMLMRIARRAMMGQLTAGVGVSREAMAVPFGPRWAADPRLQVLHCGLDLGPFDAPLDRDAVRTEFGLAEDAFVLGHVGRFEREKNHGFLLEIAAELVSSMPQTRVLLVGDGARVEAVKRRAHELGIADRVVFAGLRSDVPRLMRGAMDVCVLPSLYEGLPLVLVEAQAAALPCVYSDVITPEVDVIPSLLRRMSLDDGPEAWAEAALALRAVKGTVPCAEALEATKAAGFDVDDGVKALLALYEAELERAKA
ncbi:glycosyltransferase [bacterium]|nr:glycosyltransferase [bacterium]